MTRTLIIMELPNSLPTPRYRFWQRVRFGRVGCSEAHSGQIVGIEWMSLWVEEEPRWAYRVLLDEGHPCKRVEPCPFVWESEVEEVISE